MKQAAKILTILSICIFLCGCNSQEDYSEYINKTWIVKEWEGGAYNQLSFRITEIQDGKIKGSLATGAIVEPDAQGTFVNASDDYLADLEGDIKNGKAECRFSDKSGNSGTISMAYKNNREIEVQITYETEGDRYYVHDKIEKEKYNGNYTFKPYNLEAYQQNLIADKEVIKTVDLDNLGEIQLAAEVFDNGDHTFPALYLTNLEGDILYCLDSYYTESSIQDVQVEDINGDGLKDIRVILDLGMQHEIEYEYLQTELGYFQKNQSY